MSARRKTALFALAAGALSVGGSLWLSPPAFAGQASPFDGHYLLTFSANQNLPTGKGWREQQDAYPDSSR